MAKMKPDMIRTRHPIVSCSAYRPACLEAIHLNKMITLVFAALLLSWVSGCSSAARCNVHPSETKSGYVRIELFFGLSKGNGGMVTEAEWKQFLDTFITPQFKDGLTIYDASGQWLESDRLIHEKTKIVLLIYKRNPDVLNALKRITDEYKRHFNQHSVLQVISCVDEVQF